MSKATATPETTPSGTTPTEKVLIVRTCAADRKSYDGKFVYPESGVVECPDWNPRPECGGGLHGWLWGQGDFSPAYQNGNGALWMVIEADAADVVQLDNKVKFRRGNVLLVTPQWWKALELARSGRPKPAAPWHAAATGNYGHAAVLSTCGKAKAGPNGLVALARWDAKIQRCRLVVGYVGENGIKPDTWYRVDESGQLVQAV